MRRLTAKSECVRAVAFLPDGRLLSASGKKQVAVWDPTDGIVTETIRTPMSVFSVAVSPDGANLAIAGKGKPNDTESVIQLRNTAKLVDTTEYRWPLAQDPRSGYMARAIWSLAFSGDGEYLFAARRMLGGGSFDGTGCRWWKLKPPFATSEVADVPNGYAVGTAREGTRFVVTVRAEFLLFDHPRNPASAAYVFSSMWSPAAAYLPNGTDVVVAASSFLLFTDTKSPNGQPSRFKTGLREIRSLVVSPDQRTLYVGGSPGRVEVYDLPTREKRTAYDFDLGPVQSLAFAPDGLTLAVGAEKGLIVVDVE